MAEPTSINFGILILQTMKVSTNSLVNGRIGRERMVRRTTGAIKLAMAGTYRNGGVYFLHSRSVDST